MLAAEDADAADGTTAVRLAVPLGAPFGMAAALAAQGAALSSETAAVRAGQTLGEPVQAARAEGGGAATVSIAAPPAVPGAECGDGHEEDHPCFRGLRVRPGPPVTLFEAPAAAVLRSLLERLRGCRMAPLKPVARAAPIRPMMRIASHARALAR